MMPQDYQGSKEFQEWWNSQFDPSETGRARTIAARAFDAGMAARKIDAGNAFPLAEDARGLALNSQVGRITRS